MTRTLTLLKDKNSEAVVDRRFDIVYLFDVADGNPNGDPDAGNMPRLDPQSLQGYVTDVCLKRKIRNAVAAMAGDQPPYRIYVQTQDAVYEKRVLTLLHKEAYKAVGAADDEKDVKKRGDNTSKSRAWMCKNFYDIRAFGAVMTLSTNCGQVRGPAQITFARSVDPIVPLDISITRKSVATEAEAEKQVKKDGYITGTMGRKNLVPYALYRGYGFVNPYLAKDTGFTYGDLDLFLVAMRGQMWEIDRSASHGLMATRGLYLFEHESPLGSAPAHDLFNRVQIRPFRDDGDRAIAPRSFEDYRPRLTVQTEGLPTGVTVHRIVG